MRYFRFCLVAFLFVFLSAQSAQAGIVLVLKLDGVDGDCTIPGHANEITITGASFATEQAGSSAARDAAMAGFGAGKATFSPLVIFKGTDKASPQLFLRSALGNSIKSAKLSFLSVSPNSSSPPVEFFTIRLGNVFVSKYTVGSSINDEANFEEVTLFYNKATITYIPPVGPPVVTGFDLKSNRPISVID